MAEEILNIENIPDKPNKVVFNGITSVEFKHFTKSLDAKFKTIHELIISGQSGQQVSNKLLTDLRKSYNKQYDKLSSIDTGINNINKYIDAVTLINTNATNTNTKPFDTSILFTINNTTEAIVDNIKTLNNTTKSIADNIKTLNGTTKSIVDNIKTLNGTVSNDKPFDVSVLFTINNNVEKILKTISTSNKDTYTSTKISSPNINKPLIGRSSLNNVPESVDFKSTLMDITKLIEVINKINPSTANKFNESFKIISNGIANGFKNISGSLDSDSENTFKNVTSMLEVIQKLISEDSSSNGYGSRSSGGNKLFSNIFKNKSPDTTFNKKNTERFSESFKIIANGIVNGLNEFNNIGNFDDKDIINKLKLITSIQSLASSNSLSLVDSILFSRKLKSITASLTSTFIDIRDMKLPTDKKLEQLNKSIYSLNSIVDVVNNVKFSLVKSTSLVLFLDGITSSLDRLGNKSKTFDRGIDALISGITKITNAVNSLDTTKFKSINLLAAGIGMLGLSLFAFALLTPAVAVAAMGLLGFGYALKFLSNTRSLRDIGIFTASLAMLGLSMWAFQEIVNIKTIGSSILALGTLAATVWLFSGKGSKILGITGGIGPAPYKNMLYVALGLTALAGGIWVWQKLDIRTESVLQVVAGAAAMAVMAWSFNKVTPKSLLLMISTGLSVAALGYSIHTWNKLNIGWETIGVIAGGVTVLGLAAAAYSFIPVLGPANMLLVGGSLVAMGYGLSKFPILTPVEYLSIAGFITALGLSTYLYANPLASLGAANMILIGGGLSAMAIGIRSITNSNMDDTKLEQFKHSTISIIDMFKHMSIKDIATATLKSGLLIPVMASTTITATSLRIMMAMNYDSEKITQFTTSTNNLLTWYNSLKIKELGAAAIKGGLLLPIAITTTTAALAIRTVQALKIDPNKIQSSADGMKLFINQMTDVFSEIGPKMKQTKNGIKSVSKLSGTIKSLADAVFTMSKMEYVESEIKNGKIVPIKVRKLTEKDFFMVGDGVGKMLDALIDPLVKIGSSKKTFKLGNKVIQNPFAKGNDVEKGIKSISKIGSIFTPLTEIIKTFSEGNLFDKDKDPSTAISNFIGSTVDALAKSITNLNTIPTVKKDKIKNIETVLKGISTLVSSLAVDGDGEQINSNNFELIFNSLDGIFSKISEIDSTGIKAYTDEVSKLHNLVKDNKTWNRFDKNMSNQAKSFGVIKKELNGLDIKKGIIIQEITKNIKDANDNNNIARLIEEISKLINAVDTNNQSQNQFISSVSNFNNQTTPLPTQPNNTTNKDSIGSDELSLLRQKVKELETQVSNNASSSQISTAIEGIASILTTQTLKVRVSEY